MNTNLFFETILVLFAILASNGILYSLTFFKFNKPNSSENISVITNSSEKDGLVLTSLIASSPITLALLESDESQSLSLTSSDSSESQTLSVNSSETNVSEDIYDIDNLTNVSQAQDVYDIDNLYYSDISGGTYTSLDSITILDDTTFELWREIVMDLHDMPYNSPAGVLIQIKLEELNILYSQDIIAFGITQTELRLIIEHLPAFTLFNPAINHFILSIMSYYHT